MTERAGVLRSRSRWRRPRGAGRSAPASGAGEPEVAAWETTNLHTIASALLAAAARAGGDPRLALARGLPRAGRPPLGRPPGRQPRRRGAGASTSARRRSPPPSRPGPGRDRPLRVPSVGPDAMLSAAGLDPLRIRADVAGRRRRGPAGCGRHHRGDPGSRRARSAPTWSARADGVVAGLPWPRWSSPGRRSPAGRRADRPRTATTSGAGTCCSACAGPVALLLTAERTALNLLCHLSGIATATARWVEALDGHRGAGPRHPQDDARAAGTGEVRRALRRRASTTGRPCRTRRWSRTTTWSPRAGWWRPSRRSARAYPDLPVEVEVTTLDQLRDALQAGATGPAGQLGHGPMREAVRLDRRARPAGGLGRADPGGPARSPPPASTTSRSAR